MDTDTAFDEEVSSDEEEWMTLEEYAGPKGINSLEHAREAVKDFESRPHKRSERLRKKGVLEYKIVKDRKHKRTGRRGESRVTADADINAADYTAAKGGMRAGRRVRAA
eukprot:1916044-Pyramimonas_sp.AAC.1